MMFAIGEAKTKVNNEKIEMPAAYHLNRKKVYGMWLDNNLYLSDNERSLKARKRDGDIFTPTISTTNQLKVLPEYENYEARITGCITTIEIALRRRKRNV